MANFKEYFPHLIKLEGGYVNDKNDKGGKTKYGITEDVWKRFGDASKSIQDITIDDAEKITKSQYWDKVKGDDIISQSVAEVIADWAYNSGVSTALKYAQRIVNVEDDGKIGPKTLQAINKFNSKELFEQLKSKRESFYRAIVFNNPSQSKFLKGWLNRNNSFVFKS